MFVFDVNNQTLTKTDNFTPATDSVGYLTAKFNFLTDDWTDTVKTAIFKSKNGVKSRALVNDECEIPPEVIARSDSGYINLIVSVVGVRPDGYRIPTTEKTIRFTNSGFVAGAVYENEREDPVARIGILENEIETLQNQKAEISARVDELENSNTELHETIDTLEEYAGVRDWFTEYYLPTDPTEEIWLFSEVYPSYVPAIDFSKHENFDFIFFDCTRIARAIVNSENGKSFESAFNGCLELKYCEVDLSKAENVTDIFNACYLLEYIKIKPNSLKISIIIPSDYLTDEAIRVLIDALATVEIPQLLTLPSSIVDRLTDDQTLKIFNKNWELS